MGVLRKKINEQVKEAGSKSAARTNAEAWYAKALNNFRNKSISKGGSLRFVPGKIYVFRYDTPKTEDYLAWWDRNPIVLALDPAGQNDCGINLNLLPTEVKEQMLDGIYDKLQGQINTQLTRAADNAQAQGGLTLNYSSAKAYLDQFGFGFAVRQYIPTLKQKQAVVSYENWHLISLCDFIDLEGASIPSIRRQFSDYNKKR